jgi:hypothetical protein
MELTDGMGYWLGLGSLRGSGIALGSSWGLEIVHGG